MKIMRDRRDAFACVSLTHPQRVHITPHKRILVTEDQQDKNLSWMIGRALGRGHMGPASRFKGSYQTGPSYKDRRIQLGVSAISGA